MTDNDLKPFIDPHRDLDIFNKGFAFIMKNLRPKSNKFCVKLMVPDTVFFQYGNPKFLVYNKKDRDYKFICTP